jgi:predicted nucleic acid-binding Zn finger protein
LGLVYRVELVLKTKKEHKLALKLTYSAEMYSNIQDLENEYNEMLREKRDER